MKRWSIKFRTSSPRSATGSKTLSKDAPKILHDSLASFANALEKRLEDAAGPLGGARKELASRRNKAEKNAHTFENRFGKPLTDLLKSQIGEAFEGIPRVGREPVGSVAAKRGRRRDLPACRRIPLGLIDRLVSHIGNAEQTDSLTGTTSDDLKVMTEFGARLRARSLLPAFRKPGKRPVLDRRSARIARNSEREGPVARDQANNVLVSFLVAARVSLTISETRSGRSSGRRRSWRPAGARCPSQN